MLFGQDERWDNAKDIDRDVPGFPLAPVSRATKGLTVSGERLIEHEPGCLYPHWCVMGSKRQSVFDPA